MCIDKLSPLSVGCELKLSFTLPGGQLIEAEGVVMRSQPGMGMGAAFTRLKPEDVEQIREFIEK